MPACVSGNGVRKVTPSWSASARYWRTTRRSPRACREWKGIRQSALCLTLANVLTVLRSLLARHPLAPEHRAQALLDAASLHQLRAELPEARHGQEPQGVEVTFQKNSIQTLLPTGTIKAI